VITFFFERLTLIDLFFRVPLKHLFNQRKINIYFSDKSLVVGILSFLIRSIKISKLKNINFEKIGGFIEPYINSELDEPKTFPGSFSLFNGLSNYHAHIIFHREVSSKIKREGMPVYSWLQVELNRQIHALTFWAYHILKVNQSKQLIFILSRKRLISWLSEASKELYPLHDLKIKKTRSPDFSSLLELLLSLFRFVFGINQKKTLIYSTKHENKDYRPEINRISCINFESKERQIYKKSKQYHNLAIVSADGFGNFCRNELSQAGIILNKINAKKTLYYTGARDILTKNYIGIPVTNFNQTKLRRLVDFPRNILLGFLVNLKVLFKYVNINNLNITLKLLFINITLCEDIGKWYRELKYKSVDFLISHDYLEHLYCKLIACEAKGAVLGFVDRSIELGTPSYASIITAHIHFHANKYSPMQLVEPRSVLYNIQYSKNKLLFKSKKLEDSIFQNKNKKKFKVLTFFDEALHESGSFHPLDSYYRLAIDFIKENPNYIVLIKPKRNNLLDNLSKQTYSALYELEKKKRVVVFDHNFSPAALIEISDFVVSPPSTIVFHAVTEQKPIIAVEAVKTYPSIESVLKNFSLEDRVSFMDLSDSLTKKIMQYKSYKKIKAYNKSEKIYPSFEELIEEFFKNERLFPPKNTKGIIEINYERLRKDYSYSKSFMGMI